MLSIAITAPPSIKSCTRNNVQEAPRRRIHYLGHFVTFTSSPKNIVHMPKTPKSLEALIKLVRLPLPHIENLQKGVENTMDILGTKNYFLKKAYEGFQDAMAELLKLS
ncbi:Soyasaponin III rhamnosyltransferase [Spatholobus suberectus]|nr:Soyasaponin III rhamnosyltransferase [Spatholobus suberectus]